MDSGLEECILPSIRRSQILLIYRNGGVDNPETFGQIACAARLSEGWRPYGQDPCEVGRPRKNKIIMLVSGQTQGSAPTTIFAINFPDVWIPRLLMCMLLTTHPLFSPVSRPSEVLDRKVSIYVCPNGTMICCGPSTFFIEQCSTAIPATHPLEE